MFLTRLGFGSKIVVTGDVTQVDLPGGTHERAAGRPGDPRRRRGRALLPAVQRRRGAAPAGRRHRRRVRPVTTTSREAADRARRTPWRTAGSAGASGADDVHRDRQRVRRRGRRDARSRLARHVLDEMGVNPLAELSILLVDIDYMAELHGVDGRGRPDRRARVPDGRAAARPRRRREPEPALLGDIVLCPEVAAEAGGRGRALRRPTSCTCSPCTACCTCSATTTPSRRRSGRCSRCRRELLRGVAGRERRRRSRSD